MDFDFEFETNNVCVDKKLKWTVHNVGQCPLLLQSPKFAPIPDLDCVIQLDRREPKFKCNFMSFQKRELNFATELEGKLTFVNPLTSKSVEEKFRKNFLSSSFSHEVSFPFSFKDLLRAKLELSGDALVVEFHMAMVVPSRRVATLEEAALCDREESSDIVVKIYKQNILTDVTFNFEKQTLSAHKVILSVTSPVFKKMFEHDTLENRNNSVSIEDVDIEVFHGLLEFLYAKKIKENIKISFDSMLGLYEVSDKYEVRELQKICANILLSNFLNIESVCKILAIADLHGDGSLKDKLFGFLKEKFPEVSKTEEWSSLTTENIKLASEVVAFITSKIN